MSAEHARAVADWCFDGIYSLYNLRNDPDEIASWLDPKNWGDTFAVLDRQGILVGEYSYTPGDGCLEIGLTLRPDLTGLGMGLEFLQASLDLARDRYEHKVFSIRVWELNARARKTYERAGFRTCAKEKMMINDMPFTFLVLTMDR